MGPWDRPTKIAMTSGQHVGQTSTTTYVRDHDDYSQNALDAKATLTAFIVFSVSQHSKRECWASSFCRVV